MGACNIEFEIKKQATRAEIVETFKNLQAEGAAENGSQEGYSGDFQTVREVKDHTHKTFDSYEEAEEYCLEHAKKWEHVVAVYYRVASYKPSAKAQKLQAKINDLHERLVSLKSAKYTLPAFKTCEGCQSKVNTLKMRGHKCPVCNEGDFRPLSHQRSELSLKAKIAQATEASVAFNKAEQAKALTKNSEVRTLIAGWGAC